MKERVQTKMNRACEAARGLKSAAGLRRTFKFFCNLRICVSPSLPHSLVQFPVSSYTCTYKAIAIGGVVSACHV